MTSAGLPITESRLYPGIRSRVIPESLRDDLTRAFLFARAQEKENGHGGK